MTTYVGSVLKLHRQEEGSVTPLGLWTCPHQVLAATLNNPNPYVALTLALNRGGADYVRHILMSPPSFESHRRSRGSSLVVLEISTNADFPF